MTPLHPPRALVVAASAALVVGLVVAVAGAWRTGVSWDEAYHVLRMRNFLEHGWYLLDADLDHGTPGGWVDQRYVYAPVTMLVLHGWSMLLGVDTPGQVAVTDQAYAVRHLAVVLISFVGVAATATITRLLLRSWGWAVVSAAVLVAVPTWTGHAMFNVKDVPVATGYTLVTLGVIVLSHRAHARWIGPAAVTVLAGLVLAMGTRPGIAPGLALAGLVGLVVVISRRQWGRAVLVLVLGAVAVLALRLIYPEAFANPVTALVEGALSSSRYGGKQGSWWYLPLYLGVELPTLLLLLGAAGTVIVGRRALRVRDAGAVIVLLVLLQTFLLPGLAVANESNLYTGLRQLLFAAPGLAVLATCSLAALWQWSSTRVGPRRGLVRVAVPVLTAAAIGVPLLVQLQLFPYSYAFSSVPAGVISPRLAVDDRDLEVQSDYWRTSVRELAPFVPTTGYVVCTPRIDAEDRFLPSASESRRECTSDPVGPLAPYAATRAGAPLTDPTRFVAVDAGSAFVGRNCEPLHRITRHLWWRTVTMSSVSDCDLALADYPVEGVRFDGAGSGADYLRGDWEMLREDPGAGLTGRSGLVGLTLPDDLAGRALSVTGAALGAAAMSATANGTAVPVTTDGDLYRLDVPASVAGAYGERRLLLTVSDAAPLDLRLLSLAVHPQEDP